MKIIRWLDDNLEEALLIALLVTMTLLMGLQVFSRYILNASLSWSEELTRYLFIWSGFLSISYCIKKWISIKIDQVILMFPKPVYVVAQLVLNVILFALFAFLAWHAVTYLQMSIASAQKIEDPAEASAAYPWIIATDSPKDTVTGLFAHKFAEEVERLSNGSIHMQVYENGTLGSDRELIESCMGQDIPFVLQNTAPQTNFMPKLAIFDLPVAYTDIKELRNTLDDPDLMSMINKVYREKGFRLLAMGDQSFRVMTTNRKIQSIDDFKGQKIRTMENPYHIAFWQSIDANPTPMTFSEVYIGLQQGTIDAQENPYEVVVSGKIYEQQDYIVQTNHLPHLLSLIVNDEFYQSLSSEDQKIVDKAAENARNYARQQADERVNDRLNIITGSGTTIIELEDSMIDQLREKAQPVYENIKAQTGDALYEAYTKRMQ